MRQLQVGMLALIGMLLLAGMSLGAPGQAGADDASTDHPAIGAWRMMAGGAAGTPEGDPTLATFAPDGTLILTGRAVRPALPGMPFKFVHFSAGHGVWESTGEGSVSFTVVHLRSDESGNYRGTVTVSGTLDVSGDGQSITGVETFTVGDPTGKVVSAFPDALEGTRISVEPMADVGTPVAG